uniref:Uncharacterized protein n=1 Tax=viral metagenome TaxID=1070528 RepID=A0A6C0JS17_9ZZZZ
MTLNIAKRSRNISIISDRLLNEIWPNLMKCERTVFLQTVDKARESIILHQQSISTLINSMKGLDTSGEQEAHFKLFNMLECLREREQELRSSN